MLGYKNFELNKNRFKYDALDYYQADITWFQFQLAPLIMHAIVIAWRGVFNPRYIG